MIRAPPRSTRTDTLFPDPRFFLSIQADCGYAMCRLRGAGNRLMDGAGPGAFALSNPLQRSWRDLCVGTRHNALSSHLSLELYGRAIAGHPSNIQLLPDIGPSPAWATPQ